MNLVNNKTGKSLKIEDALVIAGQQAYIIKPKEAWLLEVGSLLKFEYRKKHGKVVYTFKWNQKENKLDIYDSDNKYVKSLERKSETKVSSDVSNATAKKNDKSTK